MKLSKRKLRILFIALSILTILVVFLCSFAPPSFSSDTAIIVSRPSQIDIENLLAIVDLQYLTGTFNDLKPVCCFLNSSYNSIYLLLTNRKDYSLSIENSILSIPGQTDRFILTADGFTVHSIVGNGTVNIDRVLFYRPSYNEDLIFNSSFTPSGSSNGQDSISDIVNYFSDFYNIIINFENYIDNAESVGYSDGYSEGYSEGESVGYASGNRDGFDDGREEGYTLGYDVGYDDGYKRGEDIGSQTGFNQGYETGYEEGYSEGYETGYNIVYDDLQQPGTIQTIFTTKDSSGNILYLAQEMDIENFEINYAFLPKDQLSNSYVGYRLFVKTYDVTKYLENNPLDFDYPLPVIEYKGTDFLALYRKVNVTREYIDLYNFYSVVEVKIDQSFIDQLHNEYNEGLNDANAIVNGIGDIASKPITSLKDALNFEIFGLNIGVVAIGLVAILFAIWAYNKIRKILPI